MNVFVAEQRARWHQQDLLDEAGRERLAAIAHGSTNDRLRDAGRWPLQLLIRSAAIALVAALADGHGAPASHHT